MGGGGGGGDWYDFIIDLMHDFSYLLKITVITIQNIKSFKFTKLFFIIYLFDDFYIIYIYINSYNNKEEGLIK